MDDLAHGSVLGLSSKASVIWQKLNLTSSFGILDIIIVALIFYWLFNLLKGTKALRILYGIAILAIIFFLGQFLQLTALNFLLRYFFTGIIVAIPVVFQPELRSALEKLGRTSKFVAGLPLTKDESAQIAQKVISALKNLSQNKIGALICLGRQTGLREYIETGTILNAELTTPLLLNIFSPKAALHDGATIILDDKIISAGCTLPLSEEKRYDMKLGTRHKAALGLSEQTDAVCLVVSEENGAIAMAISGKLLTNLTQTDFEERLPKLLRFRK